ncbi:MAG: PIN domain-containing protein [Candidatus Woesearchaeota archaeon]|nr:PIN domain-containing protein [Candidatus Woesearchaeota archaeon]
MILVIDTNILLAGLIKDSTVRKIIVESGWKFHYPEMSFHEVWKYKGLVLEKSGMNEEEYAELLNHLLKHITLVPEERIKPKIEEANDLLGKIDPDDVVFLATAFSIEDSKIWSDDSHLEKQTRTKVLKTRDIVKLFSQDGDLLL